MAIDEQLQLDLSQAEDALANLGNLIDSLGQQLSDSLLTALDVLVDVPVTADASGVTDALTAALDAGNVPVVVDADTTALSAGITDAIAVADAPVVLTGDATDVEASLTGAIAAADTQVVLVGDATDVASAIDVAVASADSTVDVTGDASEVTSAIEDAVNSADTTVDLSVNDNGGISAADGQLNQLSSSADGASQHVGGLTSSLGGAATEGVGLGAIIGGLTPTMGAAGVAIGGAALGIEHFVEAGITGTSAAQRFETTVGDLAKQIEQVHVGNLNTDLFGLTQSLGSTRAATENAGATIFRFAENAGAGKQESAGFTDQLLALASRAVALKPSLGDVADVAVRMEVGLGRARSASQQFGISVSQAEINTRALSNTGKQSASDLTAYEKSVAGVQIALERYGTTLKGDIASGQANVLIQERALKAAFDNFIESASAPLVSPALELMQAAIPVGEALATSFASIAQGALPVLIGGLEALGGGLLVVTTIAQPFLDAFNAIPGPLKETAGALFVLDFAGTRVVSGISSLVERFSAMAVANAGLSTSTGVAAGALADEGFAAVGASELLLTEAEAAQLAATANLEVGASGDVAGAGLTVTGAGAAAAGAGLGFFGTIASGLGAIITGIGEAAGGIVFPVTTAIAGLHELFNNPLLSGAAQQAGIPILGDLVDGVQNLGRSLSSNIPIIGGWISGEDKASASAKKHADSLGPAEEATKKLTAAETAYKDAVASHGAASEQATSALQRFTQLQQQNGDASTTAAAAIQQSKEAIAAASTEASISASALGSSSAGWDRLTLAVGLYGVKAVETDAVAGAFGVSFKQLGTIADAVGKQIDSFVTGALGKLPQVSDAFKHMTDPKQIGADEFLANLQKEADAISQFGAQIQTIAAAGFTGAAAALSSEGFAAGGTIAKQLAEGINNQQPEVAKQINDLLDPAGKLNIGDLQSAYAGVARNVGTASAIGMHSAGAEATSQFGTGILSGVGTVDVAAQQLGFHLKAATSGTFANVPVEVANALIAAGIAVTVGGGSLVDVAGGVATGMQVRFTKDFDPKTAVPAALSGVAGAIASGGQPAILAAQALSAGLHAASLGDVKTIPADLAQALIAAGDAVDTGLKPAAGKAGDGSAQMVVEFKKNLNFEEAVKAAAGKVPGAVTANDGPGQEASKGSGKKIGDHYGDAIAEAIAGKQGPVVAAATALARSLDGGIGVGDSGANIGRLYAEAVVASIGSHQPEVIAAATSLATSLNGGIGAEAAGANVGALYGRGAVLGILAAADPVRGAAASLFVGINGGVGAIAAGQNVGGNYDQGAAAGINAGEGVVRAAATGVMGRLNGGVGAEAAGANVGALWDFGVAQGILDNAGGLRAAAEAVVGALNGGLGAIDAGRNIGHNFDDGIVAGISENSEVIRAGAITAVHNAVAGAVAALNANSPSRLTRDEIGKPFAQGIAAGINDQAPLAVDAVTNLITTLGAQRADPINVEVHPVAVDVAGTINRQITAALADIRTIEVPVDAAVTVAATSSGTSSSGDTRPIQLTVENTTNVTVQGNATAADAQAIADTVTAATTSQLTDLSEQAIFSAVRGTRGGT